MRYQQRAWPKLTAVIDVASRLIVGAVAGTGPSQDAPGFAPALRQACTLTGFDAALADAGYDAEHNHRLCRDLGLRRSAIALNRRNTDDRAPKTPLRRAMHDAFPNDIYGQRWQIESAFSQHKRRLGSALAARSDPSQAREMLLRVLTHNIALVTEAA